MMFEGIYKPLGCFILPKVIGFIDYPPYPPSEIFKKIILKQGPLLRHLGYVYDVLRKALPRKNIFTGKL